MVFFKLFMITYLFTLIPYLVDVVLWTSTGQTLVPLLGSPVEQIADYNSIDTSVSNVPLIDVPHKQHAIKLFNVSFVVPRSVIKAAALSRRLMEPVWMIAMLGKQIVQAPRYAATRLAFSLCVTWWIVRHIASVLAGRLL